MGFEFFSFRVSGHSGFIRFEGFGFEGLKVFVIWLLGPLRYLEPQGFRLLGFEGVFIWGLGPLRLLGSEGCRLLGFEFHLGSRAFRVLGFEGFRVLGLWGFSIFNLGFKAFKVKRYKCSGKSSFVRCWKHAYASWEGFSVNPPKQTLKPEILNPTPQTLKALNSKP